MRRRIVWSKMKTFFYAGEFGAQEGFDFGVVGGSDGGVVGEELFFGGVVVDCEAGVVGCEFMFAASEVVDLTGVCLEDKVGAGPVDLGPRFPRVGRCVDVDKVCCSHSGSWWVCLLWITMLDLGQDAFMLPLACGLLSNRNDVMRVSGSAAS